MEIIKERNLDNFIEELGVNGFFTILIILAWKIEEQQKYETPLHQHNKLGEVSRLFVES